jgi:hypothetical protein
VIKEVLEGLKSTPAWVTHLGCQKGCLDYLGSDASMPWLYGATGHAFVINMHDVVCPSSPTARHTEPLLMDLSLNIGYVVTGIMP